VKISLTPEFKELFRKLPSPVKKQAGRAFEHLEYNPRYPSLRLKCVDPQESRYSIRISNKYRALGVLKADEIVLEWIGSHGNYDHLI
jgi:mRNA-degrading endonuclease RelE of RelBE toxin-antitoxin system